ncbi:MAG: DNA polymerase/3'-5' exonuclease PolX [Methanoregula sp.]
MMIRGHEKNRQVAALFFEVAELLRIKGETFKPQAYTRAARAIEMMDEDITDIAAHGKLEDIHGVGTHLAKKIDEIVRTGRLTYLETLKKELPGGVRELAELEGIGPKKAMFLTKELGISTVAGLEDAAKAGRIRDLAGFGEQSEANILRSIRTKKSTGGRFLLGQIIPVARDIVRQLAELPATQQVSVAGSIRRMKETIGDVDIVAASGEPEKVMERFCTLPDVDRVLVRGPTRSSILLANGLQVDLRVVGEDQYGPALLYFTGSKDHNIALRRLALERHSSLNEYRITDLSTGRITGQKNEAGVYRMLGLQFIEPELRENRGEIEAAREGRLPDIVSYSAIRGDFHVHTSWSDGAHTIREMTEAARALRYEYIAVSDHTRSHAITRGLTGEQVAGQRNEIEQVNRSLDDFEVLAGVECNINVDGTLDIPGSILRDLDVVVAGVHSNLKMEKDEMTRRIITAMHNDYVDIISHPTGRIIQKREAAALDLDRVFETAASLGIFLEINGFPGRLDLSDMNCMKAREHKVRFALGSDAHSADTLRNMEFCVATACRGWLEAEAIINTLTSRDLHALLGS